jgi:uncharacterized 2Fe-2S/4Fe-4S cluster protein (DUF4445 family)
MNHCLDFEPLGQRYLCPDGTLLLDAARQAGVQLVALCGGQGTCGRCLVQVREGQAPPPSSVEQARLTAAELEAGYRLACQLRVIDDLRIHIPVESLSTSQRTQVEGQESAIELDPPVNSVELQVAPPTLADLRADADRVCDALAASTGRSGVRIAWPVLRDLPTRLRAQDWRTVAVLRHSEVVALLRPGEGPFGLAVDVGTTKLAAYLVDLTTGRTLAAQGAMNPQIAYGEDVMARLTYARQHETGAADLQTSVIRAIDVLLRELCSRTGSRSAQVVEAVVVGNTAMHHLLLGLPTRQLGEAPYVAAVREPLDVRAHDLGLSLAPGAYVHLLPNIAGFVGADHVAMLLATGIPNSDGSVLGLDIGTNTEVALRANGRFLTCSTASGPAFEGAHIRHGMRAAAGAIERLRIVNSNVEYETIEGSPPVGLCGSGILDAVAQMRLAGVLDERGGFRHNAHVRVRDGERGAEFLLVPAAESGTGQDIVLTRTDVGQIQLAKGAICAGINVLLDEAQIRAEELDEVIVAGAFGTYIDTESAIAIGLLPSLCRDRFRQVGNAAGMGAKRVLVSQAERRRARRLACELEYLELTNDPRFSIQFAEAMFIP